MQAELSSLYPAHDRARLIAAARRRTSCRSYAGASDTADFAALSYALGRYRLPGVRMVFCPVAEDFFTGALLATRRITGCRRIAAVIAQDTPAAASMRASWAKAWCWRPPRTVWAPAG